MIGLDTNVLVRYIVQDDPVQAAAATTLIESRCTEESPGFVSQLVLAEIFWVLARGYGYPKPLLVQVFNKLMGAAELEIEDLTNARAALRMYESGPAGLADLLIAQRARSAGCETTFTFDRNAAKSSLCTLIK